MRNRLGLEAANRATPAGGLISAVRGVHGGESGDVVYLPVPDFSSREFVKLTSANPDDAAVCRDRLKQQVSMRWRRCTRSRSHRRWWSGIFQAIWQSTQSEFQSVSSEERLLAEQEIRAIAERRIRLGAVLAETARRRGIEARGSALKDPAVAALLAETRPKERPATRKTWLDSANVLLNSDLNVSGPKNRQEPDYRYSSLNV
jgi:hypothetical protein